MFDLGSHKHSISNTYTISHQEFSSWHRMFDITLFVDTLEYMNMNVQEYGREFPFVIKGALQCKCLTLVMQFSPT